MPKTYEPTYEKEYGEGMYSDMVYIEVKMMPDKAGRWVQLETYNDVVAQKDAQIARLKRKLKEMEEHNANQ